MSDMSLRPRPGETPVDVLARVTAAAEKNRRFDSEPRDDDEVGRWVVTVSVPADADLPNASAIEAAVQAILPRGFVVEVEVEA